MGSLIELLEARSGIVCAVGAGGKKTTLYHLAASHPGRVGLTCTVSTTHFPTWLNARVVVAPAAEIAAAVTAAASQHRIVAFARPSEKRTRFAGLAPELISELAAAAGFDVLLVKADGARMRWVKAPNEDEPTLPAGTTTLVPIVSARAIGEPLSERTAHRIERVERITGARRGERLTPQHVARLLTDERGALKGAAEATVVPLINMVDDSQHLLQARETARLALELSDRLDRVVLTSSTLEGRVVEVIER